MIVLVPLLIVIAVVGERLAVRELRRAWAKGETLGGYLGVGEADD